MVVVGVMLFPPLWLPVFGAMCLFFVLRRLRQVVFKPVARHSKRLITQQVNLWMRTLASAGPKTPRWRLPTFLRKSVRTRDGVTVQYFVIPAKRVASKPAKPKVMLLCTPLGGQGFQIFIPLIHFLEDAGWTFITWDYRGLFSSDTPSRKRRIAVPEHAEDAREILAAEGISVADVVVGHSMGVQVSLELATLWPSYVDRLILLNGAHGQVFSSAFQPVFRVPVVGDFARGLVQFLISHHHWLNIIRVASKPWVRPILYVYAHLFGDLYLKNLLGPEYLGFVFSRRRLRCLLRLPAPPAARC